MTGTAVTDAKGYCEVPDYADPYSSTDLGDEDLVVNPKPTAEELAAADELGDLVASESDRHMHPRMRPGSAWHPELGETKFQCIDTFDVSFEKRLRVTTGGATLAGTVYGGKERKPIERARSRRRSRLAAFT